jgi:tRNA-splicing ligase RtcB
MPIKSVISKSRVPVKMWVDVTEVESSAIDQLTNTASLPFVFKHVAVMPDVHYGRGATVGTVVATKGAVLPAAVGVDIGCGMYAVKTSLRAAPVAAKAAEIRHSIERSIPTGHRMHGKPSPEVLAWKGWNVLNYPGVGSLPFGRIKDGEHFAERAKLQLGTLGGGNHFIEVSQDLEGCAWVMLHSGSRHIGLRIAMHYLDRAKDLMKTLFIKLPDPDLAYLPLEPVDVGCAAYVSLAKEYLQDLDWAQQYAWANREEMMRLVLKDLGYAMGCSVDRVFEVHCHHNYAAMENHFGENVLVTRKGAVRARLGEYGIIPGSMGAKSFITKGLGNPESFCSSSHGAGRRMSRSAAKKQFTAADVVAQTEGIECAKDLSVVDEIPGAYKDIDAVMANQTDLVEVVAELRQILCVKGGKEK